MLESTERAGSVLSPDPEGDAAEARTLKLLLGINGAMFVFEMVVGVMAQSTGLIADSLDMFADAAVYGLALYAVGRAHCRLASGSARAGGIGGSDPARHVRQRAPVHAHDGHGIAAGALVAWTGSPSRIW